jgi:hypothetical protein
MPEEIEIIKSSNVERQVLLGLMISKEFCTAIIPKINFNYFTASYSRSIAQWCVEYFKSYNIPVNMQIGDIYRTKSKFVPEDDRELIEATLISISDSYDEDEVYNHTFYIDRAIQWFKERSLEDIKDRLDVNLRRGDIDEAENAVIKYNSITAIEMDHLSNIKEDGALDQVVDNVFNEDIRYIFHSKGVSDLIGRLYREAVVVLLADSKAGKSTEALKMALEAAEQGCNVVFFAHEMSRDEMWKKIIQILSAKSYEKSKLDISYFDCILNQTGRCRKQERSCKCKMEVRTKDGNTVNPEYLPCTFCKDNGLEDEYQVAFFVKEEEHRVITEKEGRRVLRQWLKFKGGGRFYLKAYPQYTANHRDMENYLDYLEQVQGINADVVVDDSPNMHSVPVSLKRHEAISEEWKATKRIAASKKICMICPVHCTRDRNRKGRPGKDDISESSDISKVMTDGIGIIANPDDIANGCVQYYAFASRFTGVNIMDTLWATRCLDAGIVMKDVWFQKYKPLSAADHKGESRRERRR